MTEAAPIDYSGGSGELRPDPAFPQTWRGTLILAGFPYRVTATLEDDGAGKVLCLRCVAAPLVPR